MIAWKWDSAARGVPLGGVVVTRDCYQARLVIERRLRDRSARSALAIEVRDDLGFEPTGRAMIARAVGDGAYLWRDVCLAAPGAPARNQPGDMYRSSRDPQHAEETA